MIVKMVGNDNAFVLFLFVDDAFYGLDVNWHYLRERFIQQTEFSFRCKYGVDFYNSAFAPRKVFQWGVVILFETGEIGGELRKVEAEVFEYSFDVQVLGDKVKLRQVSQVLGILISFKYCSVIDAD